MAALPQTHSVALIPSLLHSEVQMPYKRRKVETFSVIVLKKKKKKRSCRKVSSVSQQILRRFSGP